MQLPSDHVVTLGAKSVTIEVSGELQTGVTKTIQLPREGTFLLVTSKALNASIGYSMFIVTVSRYGTSLNQVVKGSNITVTLNSAYDKLDLYSDTQYVGYRVLYLPL